MPNMRRSPHICRAAKRPLLTMRPFNGIIKTAGVPSVLRPLRTERRKNMVIGILEDERDVAETIERYIRTYFDGIGRGGDIEIRYFSNAFDLLENYRADYDVLFMDIQLNVMSGMESAVLIRRQDPQVLIIFVTNLAQYAVEGYQVNAFDFILKPVDYNGFAMKLSRICKELEHRSDRGSVTLKTKAGFMRLSISRISYVEVRGHDIIYHMDGENITARGTMKNVASQLEGHYFSLCNSCYLVNLAYVKKANKTVLLSTGEELAISQGKRKQFMAHLAKYLGGTI